MVASSPDLPPGHTVESPETPDQLGSSQHSPEGASSSSAGEPPGLADLSHQHQQMRSRRGSCARQSFCESNPLRPSSASCDRVTCVPARPSAAARATTMAPPPDSEPHPQSQSALHANQFECRRCHVPIPTGVPFVIEGLSGDRYHEECFVCIDCGKQVDGVEYKPTSQGPQCLECALPQCHQCKNLILGTVCVAKTPAGVELKFHTQCLRCIKCGHNIQYKYKAGETGFLCRSCANPHCSVCRKIIDGGSQYFLQGAEKTPVCAECHDAQQVADGRGGGGAAGDQTRGLFRAPASSSCSTTSASHGHTASGPPVHQSGVSTAQYAVVAPVESSVLHPVVDQDHHVVQQHTTTTTTTRRPVPLQQGGENNFPHRAGVVGDEGATRVDFQEQPPQSVPVAVGTSFPRFLAPAEHEYRHQAAPAAEPYYTTTTASSSHWAPPPSVGPSHYDRGGPPAPPPPQTTSREALPAPASSNGVDRPPAPFLQHHVVERQLYHPQPREPQVVDHRDRGPVPLQPHPHLLPPEYQEQTHHPYSNSYVTTYEQQRPTTAGPPPTPRGEPATSHWTTSRQHVVAAPAVQPGPPAVPQITKLLKGGDWAPAVAPQTTGTSELRCTLPRTTQHVVQMRGSDEITTCAPPQHAVRQEVTRFIDAAGSGALPPAGTSSSSSSRGGGQPSRGSAGATRGQLPPTNAEVLAAPPTSYSYRVEERVQQPQTVAPPPPMDRSRGAVQRETVQPVNEPPASGPYFGAPAGPASFPRQDDLPAPTHHAPVTTTTSSYVREHIHPIGSGQVVGPQPMYVGVGERDRDPPLSSARSHMVVEEQFPRPVAPPAEQYYAQPHQTSAQQPRSYRQQPQQLAAYAPPQQVVEERHHYAMDNQAPATYYQPPAPVSSHQQRPAFPQHQQLQYPDPGPAYVEEHHYDYDYYDPPLVPADDPYARQPGDHVQQPASVVQDTTAVTFYAPDGRLFREIDPRDFEREQYEQSMLDNAPPRSGSRRGSKERRRRRERGDSRSNERRRGARAGPRSGAPLLGSSANTRGSNGRDGVERRPGRRPREHSYDEYDDAKQVHGDDYDNYDSTREDGEDVRHGHQSPYSYKQHQRSYVDDYVTPRYEEPINVEVYTSRGRTPGSRRDRELPLRRDESSRTTSSGRRRRKRNRRGEGDADKENYISHRDREERARGEDFRENKVSHTHSAVRSNPGNGKSASASSAGAMRSRGDWNNSNARSEAGGDDTDFPTHWKQSSGAGSNGNNSSASMKQIQSGEASSQHRLIGPFIGPPPPGAKIVPAF